MTLFAGLLDDRVAIAEGPIASNAGALLASEEQEVAKAVTKRRLEFSAGRTLARAALAQLGHKAVVIPRGNDRAPVWPAGITGSITHTDTYCAAAVARTGDGIQAVGIDLEPMESLEEELWPMIAKHELDWLCTCDALERGILARAIFCAKECAFKVQFPLTGVLLEFCDFAVSIDRAGERFVARFMRDANPFQEGDTLTGRIRFSDGYIAAGLVITEVPAKG